MSDEDVRLYSKPSKLPVDVVAPQHAAIHADLERWGAYNREKLQPGSCDSLEKNFDNTGGREAKRSTIALPPDPLLRAVDSVVRQMMVRVPQHGETVKLYYCGRLERRTMYVQCDPALICRLLSVPKGGFPKWMFDCRAMVINLLRRDGVVLDGE